MHVRSTARDHVQFGFAKNERDTFLNHKMLFTTAIHRIVNLQNADDCLLNSSSAYIMNT